MIPRQQKHYGTNQPQNDWSHQENPGFQPNKPIQGYPPQAKSQPIPVQPTANDVHYALLGGDIATQVCQFSEKSIRLAFIRKVCAIIMCQFAVTVVFIAVFMYQPQVNEFARTHSWLLRAALIFTIVLLIVIMCCDGLRRKWPANIILLGFFAIGVSSLVGIISALCKSDEVLMAFGICTAVCLALTIFASQTKWDFTMLSGMFLVSCVVLLIFGIAAICLQDRVISLAYCSLGVIVFSLYLVYDIRCMVGGSDRKYDVSPEEYIFAALSIYSDVIILFLRLLRIVLLRR